MFSGYINYWLIGVLLLIGLYGILTKENLLKKVMSLTIMQVAVITFFLALGEKEGGMAPILFDSHQAINPDFYVNPLPHVLMLTAIVVGVGTNGLALALLFKINNKYGSLEEPEVHRVIDK